MRDLIPLTPPYLAAAAEMHRRCFADSWDAATLAGLLAMSGAFGLVLSDPPAGFVLARVAADEAEILTIAVLPEQRRGGLGGRLLDAAAAAARQAGAAVLFLEVAADNSAGLALYRSRGFAAVGRRADYYGQNRDAVILRLDLP